MWIAWIEFDVLLGDVQSLKEKRSVLRPVIAEIRKHFDVSVAEVEHHVAVRPGIDLLSARSRIITTGCGGNPGSASPRAQGSVLLPRRCVPAGGLGNQGAHSSFAIPGRARGSCG